MGPARTSRRSTDGTPPAARPASHRRPESRATSEARGQLLVGLLHQTLLSLAVSDIWVYAPRCRRGAPCKCRPHEKAESLISSIAPRGACQHSRDASSGPKREHGACVADGGSTASVICVWAGGLTVTYRESTQRLRICSSAATAFARWLARGLRARSAATTAAGIRGSL